MKVLQYFNLSRIFIVLSISYITYDNKVLNKGIAKINSERTDEHKWPHFYRVINKLA